MRVSGNLCQQNNTVLNTGSINRSINRKINNGDTNSKSNTDRVSISPQGNMWNMIQDLTKQKENIIKQKNDLVNKTMEAGGDMESIKTQLDLYKEQIEGIDKQISDTYAQQAKEALEQRDDKSVNSSNDNKTEEELQTEKLSNLAYVSDSVKQAEITVSAKNKAEGDAKIEESEVNLGEIQLDILKSNQFTGANVKDLISNLENRLDDKRGIASSLKNYASNLDLNHGKQLGQAIDKLEDNNKSEKDSMNTDDEMSNTQYSQEIIEE